MPQTKTTSTSFQYFRLSVEISFHDIECVS